MALLDAIFFETGMSCGAPEFTTRAVEIAEEGARRNPDVAHVAAFGCGGVAGVGGAHQGHGRSVRALVDCHYRRRAWPLRQMNWMPLSLISCRGAPCSAIARSMARHAAVAVNRRAAVAREAAWSSRMSITHAGDPSVRATWVPSICVGCAAFETPQGRYRAALGSRRDE